MLHLCASCVLCLSSVLTDLKEYYYDPKFHGLDIDARFKVAEDKMKEAANLGQVLGIIAQALTELNDSHTFFVPPPHPVDVDYGWKMQMIGDTCYVVAVKAGSDAEAQGLHPGKQNMYKVGEKREEELTAALIVGTLCQDRRATFSSTIPTTSETDSHMMLQET